MENHEEKKSEKTWPHWLLICFAAVLLIIALLLHIPARYAPLKSAGDKRLVSPYLTNELLPALYNGAQMDKPFDLIITEDGVNDVIGRSGWPKDFGSVSISSSMV